MNSEIRKKKIWPKVVIVVSAVLLLAIGGMFGFILLGKDRTENLQLKGISAATLSDGVYEGKYSGFRWSNAVEVTIENHEITGIQVTKPQVVAKEATVDELTRRVLAAQSTQVDAVSRATIDSKAFLAAVEDALGKTE